MNVPMLPLSQPNAVGLVLAHGKKKRGGKKFFLVASKSAIEWLFLLFFMSPGSVGDTESVLSPDVYVSDDGGYSWLLALKGPHYYAILDSGGLLVAVEHTSAPVNQIKWVQSGIVDGF